jgi:hypothetical protein
MSHLTLPMSLIRGESWKSKEKKWQALSNVEHPGD